MKTKRITLQQCVNNNYRYTVEKLVNCTEPLAGSILTGDEVDQLIRRPHLTVTINRARDVA